MPAAIAEPSFAAVGKRLALPDSRWSLRQAASRRARNRSITSAANSAAQTPLGLSRSNQMAIWSEPFGYGAIEPLRPSAVGSHTRRILDAYQLQHFAPHGTEISAYFQRLTELCAFPPAPVPSTFAAVSGHDHTERSSKSIAKIIPTAPRPSDTKPLSLTLDNRATVTTQKSASTLAR